MLADLLANKEIYLATQNKNKVQEFQEAMGSTGWSIQFEDRGIDVVESGTTFYENAKLKAQAWYKELKKPVMADDSGLVLEAFSDILGVQSARFAPELKTYPEKCQRVLEVFEEKKESNRRAYFVCYLYLILDLEHQFAFEGRVRGTISEQLKGAEGFGYDPIFIPEGQTFSFAEKPEWKQANSHRGKAIEHLLEFLGSCVANR
jgi:XTP/dITP diphosphohydrolase